MNAQEFLKDLAQHLARELLPNESIKPLVKDNPALLGAYAEATVRRLVSRVVSPLRVSHGAVLHQDNYGSPRQIDTIIWLPCPVPAIFEIDDFALVPRGSAIGVLEIKRSIYNGAAAAVTAVISDKSIFSPLPEQLFQGSVRRALGVFCMQEPTQKVSSVHELVAAGDAVVLLTRSADTGELEPDGEGIFTLLNFLLGIRFVAKQLDGVILANYAPQANLMSGNSSTTCGLTDPQHSLLGAQNRTPRLCRKPRLSPANLETYYW